MPMRAHSINVFDRFNINILKHTIILILFDSTQMRLNILSMPITNKIIFLLDHTFKNSPLPHKLPTHINIQYPTNNRKRFNTKSKFMKTNYCEQEWVKVNYHSYPSYVFHIYFIVLLSLLLRLHLCDLHDVFFYLPVYANFLYQSSQHHEI